MSTLTDVEIGDEMQNGRLITNGDPKQLKGACYELRMGNVYYDLTESDHPITVAAGQDILIKPGHRVVLITHEELAVPDNVLVRVVCKGSLFSIGLSAVATYADPGFSGRMGIVTQNISSHYIQLPVFEPIAKADFTRLGRNVDHPYRGQHGYQTEIWPIKHHLQKTHSDVAGDCRVRSESVEAFRLLPQVTGKALRLLEQRHRLYVTAILVAVVWNAAALFLVAEKLPNSVAVLVGTVIAWGIFGFVVLRGKRRG